MKQNAMPSQSDTNRKAPGKALVFSIGGTGLSTLNYLMALHTSDQGDPAPFLIIDTDEPLTS